MKMIRGVIVAALSEGYSLIEIQDERVPLGTFPEAGNQYFSLVAAVMILMVLVCMTLIYIISCHRYRKRIQQLKREVDVYCGWNLRRLKETVAEMELQEAEDIVNDMQEILKKVL